MKNNVTELVFILDRSGSMEGLEKDTIGGFNAMLAKQKKESGVVYVSTVLFANTSKVIHDRLLLSKVPEMTEQDYFVGGCTALLDAIGNAIRHIGNIHKYARPEDVPQRTLFVITTDGQENASHQYGSDAVKKLIQQQKERYGWEFLFIGANIDAVETAANFGINQDRAVNYRADAQGTRVVFDSIAEPILAMRQMRDVDSDWATKIDADYNNRR